MAVQQHYGARFHGQALAHGAKALGGLGLDVHLIQLQPKGTGDALAHGGDMGRQARRLAGRVLCLEGGHVVADLPTDRFFAGPLPEAAAHFLQEELP